MSRTIRSQNAFAVSLLAASLLMPGAVSCAFAQASAPDSAPESEVSSGQRVTGHTRTHKSTYVKTSPEQPAPATAQKVPPSQRLHSAQTQVKEQVAPVPDAPVRPGTNVAPGQDTPKPNRR